MVTWRDDERRIHSSTKSLFSSQKTIPSLKTKTETLGIKTKKKTLVFKTKTKAKTFKIRSRNVWRPRRKSRELHVCPSECKDSYSATRIIWSWQHWPSMSCYIRYGEEGAIVPYVDMATVAEESRLVRDRTTCQLDVYSPVRRSNTCRLKAWWRHANSGFDFCSCDLLHMAAMHLSTKFAGNIFI